MPQALFDPISDFEDFGIRAFTTLRSLGSLSTSSEEPASVISARWDRVRSRLAPSAARIATARQVHGAHIITHRGDWQGWLRSDAADGHLSPARGTALGVSVADCIPVLLAHPSGATGILHAGWRGIAAGILQKGIAAFRELRLSPADLRMHLGPAICGACYEVGREVHFAVSGRDVRDRTTLDLRAELASKCRDLGIRQIAISDRCTRHHNELYFSHRGGDAGRQFAFIVADEK